MAFTIQTRNRWGIVVAKDRPELREEIDAALAAVIADGRARIGQTIFVPMPGKMIRAKVTAPMFYDAQGSRLNA